MSETRAFTHQEPMVACKGGAACGGRYFCEAGHTLCELCLLARFGVTFLEIEYLYGDTACERAMVTWPIASRALAAATQTVEVVSPDMRLLARFSLAIPYYDVVDPFGENPLVERDQLVTALRHATGL